ncbi:trophoblast glycoprotein-like [Xylocopa sonorina]|uniref:trophoblast glycoprotein-like n=1 Tax=Xylocopa sonorina TaxID=1818115 RepID=UPI00403AD154
MKIFHLIFLLICASAAESPNDCNDSNRHSLALNLESARKNCGPAFENRCYCMSILYENHYQYVVNCTNSEFTTTTPLLHLPSETQVLIFTGNYINELQSNVFGSLDRLPCLRVIDMSRNRLKEIRGKAYHHVQHVERLILDFNELSLDPGRSHSRVFSNFASLLELHLTDAFEDGPRKNLAAALHDIFVNSSLTQLMKLHLEQNEITEFQNPNVFCDLPNLLDLYLGDNALTDLHFNISCLHKLRFLDLQRNKFTKILKRDFHAMDTLIKHNQSIAVDFTRNPLECSCKLNPFIKWMNKTKVFVRNKGSLQCYEDGIPHEIYEMENCTPKLLSLASRGATIVLFLLSLLLIGLVCALIYVQRAKLQKKIEPILDSVNKRVRYTSIANGDTREDV